MTFSLLPLIFVALTADRPDLTGRVLTTEGAPVAGAHVTIDSARVRKGTSPLCPSCYLDCRKSAETDEKGAFRIASVDPELLFNVLVTNVPGPPRPLYAMGARLQDLFPVVPLAQGQAVGIGVTSYNGSVCYGLNADRDTMPDVNVLAEAMNSALAELLGDQPL